MIDRKAEYDVLASQLGFPEGAVASPGGYCVVVEIAACMRPIYTAASAEAAEAELEAFAQGPLGPDFPRGGGLAARLEPCDLVLRVPAADPASADVQGQDIGLLLLHR